MNPLLRALFTNAMIPTIKLDERDYYIAMDAMYARF